MKIYLHDMTWVEVEKILKRPNVLLIPVGSVEQHGYHLPLNVDSRCATYLAEEAAKKANAEHRIKILVAPTIHYTDVNTFQDFPGTIGVSSDTETRIIIDIARAMLKQGFHNLIFINGHATNVVPISAGLRQASLEYPEAGLYALNWWALGFDVIPKIRKSQNCLHADELETSLSLLIQPKNVDIKKAVKEIPGFALSERFVSADFYGANRVFFNTRRKFPEYRKNAGVMGDPTVASRETGRKISEAVVADLVRIILEVVRSESRK